MRIRICMSIRGEFFLILVRSICVFRLLKGPLQPSGMGFIRLCRRISSVSLSRMRWRCCSMECPTLMSRTGGRTRSIKESTAPSIRLLAGFGASYKSSISKSWRTSCTFVLGHHARLFRDSKGCRVIEEMWASFLFKAVPLIRKIPSLKGILALIGFNCLFIPADNCLLLIWMLLPKVILMVFLALTEINLIFFYEFF